MKKYFYSSIQHATKEMPNLFFYEFILKTLIDI